MGDYSLYNVTNLNYKRTRCLITQISSHIRIFLKGMKINKKDRFLVLSMKNKKVRKAAVKYHIYSQQFQIRFR